MAFQGHFKETTFHVRFRFLTGFDCKFQAYIGLASEAAARMNDLQWWWTALPDENHIKSYNRL
jgi:hypothetical protein